MCVKWSAESQGVARKVVHENRPEVHYLLLDRGVLVMDSLWWQYIAILMACGSSH